MGGPDRRFSFRGRPHAAREGETVLTALARDRLPLLRRSVQYHRPQGPFCGVGHCAGCLVRVNGRPNVRACRHLLSDGDVVETENAWPSPTFDVLAAIGFLTPNGVDTLHGLRRPAIATRLYQRVVRRLAGTGEAPDPGSELNVRAPPIERSCESVVVGAGAWGRAVASALVRRGERPLVLDRELPSSPLDGADVLSATTAVFLPPPRDGSDRPFTLLAYREPAQGIRVTARRVVVATGSYDAPLLFRGSDLPGVVTAAAAISLAAPPRSPPFRRAVVVGGGPRVAEVLARCGGKVDAVVAVGEVRPEVVGAAADLGVALYPRSMLLRARGRRSVRSLHVRTRNGGPATTIPCDAVVLAHRRLPTTQLFFQTGAAVEWRPTAGAYFPVVGEDGATTVPGVYAAGFSSSDAGGDVAGRAGVVAEAVQQDAPPLGRESARVRPSPPSELVGYYRELLRTPGHGRVVACPCVDVLLSEVEEAVRSGYRGIEVIKRYTSLGTGVCQGRYCLPETLLLLSILENRPPEEVGHITQRPPVSVTPLAALASLADASPPEVVP